MFFNGNDHYKYTFYLSVSELVSKYVPLSTLALFYLPQIYEEGGGREEREGRREREESREGGREREGEERGREGGREGKRGEGRETKNR